MGKTKKYRLSLIGLLLIAFTSCNHDKIQKDKIGHINSIVILGNSITFHPPKPELGWTGSWGMAATEPDSDYVHMLIADIHKRSPDVKVQYKSIVDFERDFNTYDLRQLDSMRGPDMLIMRISENVIPDKARDSNFLNYYNMLVKRIDSSGGAVKIITNGFIKNETADDMVKSYASAEGLQFVDLSQLVKDSTNMALNFKDSGVRLHPSNKGMKAIESAIWNSIEPYFKSK